MTLRGLGLPVDVDAGVLLRADAFGAYVRNGAAKLARIEAQGPPEASDVRGVTAYRETVAALIELVEGRANGPAPIDQMPAGTVLGTFGGQSAPGWEAPGAPGLVYGS